MYTKDSLFSKEIEQTYKKFQKEHKIRAPNLSIEKAKERSKNFSIQFNTYALKK